MWENCHDYDPKAERSLAKIQRHITSQHPSQVKERPLNDQIVSPQCGFSLDQSANEAANRPHPDTLAARLANLEAEVATLRAEVQMLRAGQLRVVDLGRSTATFDTEFICK